jgi:type II secretory ATPase GspE/PulE/Tfp pilus assembly ATPase PilB-like protein
MTCREFSSVQDELKEHMPPSLSDRYYAVLAGKTAGKAASAVEIVDSVLEAARESGASDVHLIPIESGLDVLWRIDGVPSRS